jgi:mRNA interferase RelE/StbE
VNWTYSFDNQALKDLKGLGRQAQQAIIAYLDERIAGPDDPRRFGKALRASLSGLWRYRVGDYRVICRIEDQELVILVVKVGHRRDIYE